MSTDHPDQRDDQHPAFSRTGMVAPMGTLIDELKTKVDPDTAADFRKLVNEAGTDVAGALRDWVYLKVHGKTFTDILLAEKKVKRDVLFGTGPIQALTVRGEVKS
jgi:hypothetical protein